MAEQPNRLALDQIRVPHNGETMKYTIYWKNGRKEIVDPIAMAMALAATPEEVILWREGVDNNYVWNQKTQSWEKKSIF